MDDQLLKMNGLSLEILDFLSYESQLGISLKKNLHHFDKDLLIQELIAMTEWLDEQEIYDGLLNNKSALFRVADMSKGKALDDGYRGVHVYYQKSGKHYPIEIQFNTLYDRQLNNWLHDYLYKKEYSNLVGKTMREKYESGLIKNDVEFKEVFENVLSCCKG